MPRAAKKQPYGTEAELAKLVIEWFRADGWDVFQEVPFAGIAADIVVTRGPLIGVVECKKYLNFDVLEQCDRWLPHANFVWAATWCAKRGNSWYANKVCRYSGFGLIQSYDNNIDSVKQKVDPEFRRKTSGELKDKLRPEMMSGKYGEAGSNRAGRYTPFKETCEQLCRIVSGSPGIELKPAIDLIKKHHYASNAAARANLRKYIEKGIVKDLTYRIESGKFKLYLSKNPPMIN